MKTNNKFLFSVLSSATLLVLTSNGQAQSKPDDDGISASPRLRQILGDRRTLINKKSDAQGPMKVVSETNRTQIQSKPAKDAIAASPRLRQILDDRHFSFNKASDIPRSTNATSAAASARAQSKPIDDSSAASPGSR